MTDDTRDDSGQEACRTIRSIDGRTGRRLSAADNQRRPGSPSPFSQALLHARLALLRPRPLRLRTASADEK